MRLRDFRSDTVTQPTVAMRQAMMDAKVGDDILGEDPTVLQLEMYSAKLLNKEAAMFVISGSMANQIAAMVLTQRGDEVLVGQESHIFNLEVGGLASLSQVQAVPLPSVRGRFTAEQVRGATRRKGIQAPITRLLCLENTYDLNRGIALPADYISEISEVARECGLHVYMDGARIFNAASALGVEPAELVKDVDSVMFCLSKGLAAPVGAMLVGSASLIEQARWVRQRLGGGMRQAGHMAAAGLVALRDMRARLHLDHAKAKRLAAGLSEVHPSLVDLSITDTNVVRLDFAELGLTAEHVTAECLHHGVKVKPVGDAICRMITHLDITDEDVDYAVSTIRQIVTIAM